MRNLLKVHDKINSLCPYIEDIEMKRCKTNQKEQSELFELRSKEAMFKNLQEELQTATDK